MSNDTFCVQTKPKASLFNGNIIWKDDVLRLLLKRVFDDGSVAIVDQTFHYLHFFHNIVPSKEHSLELAVRLGILAHILLGQRNDIDQYIISAKTIIMEVLGS